MRILLLYSKVGVGKSTTPAPTALHLSRRGYWALVLSVDPSYTLPDAFDLDAGLSQCNTH